MSLEIINIDNYIITIYNNDNLKIHIENILSKNKYEKIINNFNNDINIDINLFVNFIKNCFKQILNHHYNIIINNNVIEIEFYYMCDIYIPCKYILKIEEYNNNNIINNNNIKLNIPYIRYNNNYIYRDLDYNCVNIISLYNEIIPINNQNNLPHMDNIIISWDKIKTFKIKTLKIKLDMLYIIYCRFHIFF